ncbi:MAG TPA: aldose epimerase family protein [Gemmatimonadaceae bacterium]|nr:aldose epimerase family protein [Gemmatimonadaceae bacterium]
MQKIIRRSFGPPVGGAPVEVFTIANDRGVEVGITNYGARITTIYTPDRAGEREDIVLGFDNLEQYIDDTSYFGAVVGRYGNRIAGGRFNLDGKSYELAVNNGPNTLHGGLRGFDKAVWTPTIFENEGASALALEHTSADMDEGYPGNLQAQVTYTLTVDDNLIVDYSATTDKATPVNLTQHTYWNLSGNAKRDILEHELTINADSMTPVDSTLIPTGEIVPVAGSPFDFRKPAAIGRRINESPNEQLLNGGGYDHNFVLSRGDAPPGAMFHAARVRDPSTGRTLDIITTEPGLQFYSGNFLDGSITGKAGAAYRHRYGMALETQHFPDSPNQPNFPSTILRPGERYSSRTEFRFGVTND